MRVRNLKSLTKQNLNPEGAKGALFTHKLKGNPIINNFFPIKRKGKLQIILAWHFRSTYRDISISSNCHEDYMRIYLLLYSPASLLFLAMLCLSYFSHRLYYPLSLFSFMTLRCHSLLLGVSATRRFRWR